MEQRSLKFMRFNGASVSCVAPDNVRLTYTGDRIFSDTICKRTFFLCYHTQPSDALINCLSTCTSCHNRNKYSSSCHHCANISFHLFAVNSCWPRKVETPLTNRTAVATRSSHLKFKKQINRLDSIAELLHESE